MSNEGDSLTREDLMQEIDQSWHELQTFIGSLSDAQLTQPTDAAGWTAKDHIIHLAMWEKGTLAMLEGNSKREAMEIAPEIWEQDDDAINAELQQRYHDMPWNEVFQTLNDYHAAMLKKLNSWTEEDFQLPYNHYHPQSSETFPMIQAVFWDAAHHYRDHIPWMTAIVEGK